MENKGASRIRYSVIFTILLIILTIAVSIAGYFRIPGLMDYLRLKDHIELYMKGTDEGVTISLPRILYSSSGAVEKMVTIPVLNRDRLHLAAEAALTPPSDEELESGYISFIPEGTALIGISEEGGYIFIDLSAEMRKAPEEAYNEIERTIALSIPYKDIRFMINGRLAERPSEREALD